MEIDSSFPSGSMAYDNAQNLSASGDSVPLGTRAEVLPNAPIPDLNSAGGPAFAARLKGGGASDLIGILCNTGLPARLDSITAFRSIDHPSILRMIDSGVVQWPHDNAHYYAFAYQRPLSPRLMRSIDETTPVMSEDALNHHFVTPMIGALMELERTGAVHNAIRPTNIFWRIGGTTPPQLGECLSAPAGIGQPALFEPLERAMSTPMGRGMGSHSDDCYAFGVTLALLALGHNPLRGLDDNAIIQKKIEIGSFGALIGNTRLSATHIELLRGLLTDEARQRWTASDLEQWLSGRRLTPKNSDAGRRASRFFEFVGGQYWQVRPLAIGLTSHITEAVQVIEDGSLDKWLRRALGDEDRANNLEDAVNSLKESGRGANHDDQLVTRACIALDPSSPIRYRGINVMPAGISNLLVDAVATGNNIQPLSEIISSQLITFWVEMQKEVKTELVPLAQQFERVRNLIEKTTFGNGVERVTYELNTALPCLSPILRTQYVTNSKSLLPALERIAASPNRPREPMDRHIAAFLIARDRRSEILFENMVAPESSPRRGLAMLSLYSELQYRHGPDSLPNLAQWLLPLIDPAIQRYLSKQIKDRLQRQIKEAVTRGDLGTLLRLVDDPKRIEQDQQAFMAARMLYLNIMKEVAALDNQLANREIVIQGMGKPMAASLSSFVAILLILVAILRAIWQGLQG